MNWSKKRCMILDMDGTVYLGHIPIVGAVNFIQRHWHSLDFYFLSNNTSKSPASYVEKLQGMGIPASIERMLSPVSPLVDFLRANGIHRAYPVGNSDFQRDLQSRMPELQLTEDGAQAVILAYDTELTYEKLARSALLLQDDRVLFLATHPDLVCPSPEGPLPDVGSFISLYQTATGRSPQHIFGKPDPTVLAPLLGHYTKDEMVMVGDRLSTDKKLAENAGIDFILVLSGEAVQADLEKEIIQPTLVVEDLGYAESFWR
uniref:HAD-superfamily hydrolase, subfamily IIA n=1 Tax=Desulfovibrio desulfuricans (strain ATCC 27774 / DSM 6949 / MB) TaxID=525146 RepID=B8J0Z7_DESDA|nr:HAD-IIA family hydrolase [uncultured Desulfovibrio sp.]